MQVLPLNNQLKHSCSSPTYSLALACFYSQFIREAVDLHNSPSFGDCRKKRAIFFTCLKWNRAAAAVTHTLLGVLLKNKWLDCTAKDSIVHHLSSLPPSFLTLIRSLTYNYMFILRFSFHPIICCSFQWSSPLHHPLAQPVRLHDLTPLCCIPPLLNRINPACEALYQVCC